MSKHSPGWSRKFDEPIPLPSGRKHEADACNCSLPGAARAADRSVDSFKQRQLLQWFPEAGNQPAVIAQRGVAMRRDQDCRNFYAVAYEMLLKLQTVHFRHLEIDDQAVRKIGWQRREKFLPRSISPGTKSVRTQQPAQGLEHGWIIVHDSNRWRSFRHERLLRLRRAPVDWPLGQ